MTEENRPEYASVSRRYCVGLVTVLFAAVMAAGSAHAGGWDEFVKRCIVPMEAGGQPKVIGLDLVDKDPIGQAFDLPGEAHIAIRPAFQEFGTQCLVVTKPVQVAQDAFADWLDGVLVAGDYAPDGEVKSRWLTGDSAAKPLAMDAWQEGDWMVFQLSFLEAKS